MERRGRFVAYKIEILLLKHFFIISDEFCQGCGWVGWDFEISEWIRICQKVKNLTNNFTHSLYNVDYI